MKPTKLYISPHFDDVVFSCAGKILDDVRNGFRVVVATVFSEGGRENTADYHRRNKENNLALEILKAEGINLGFLDAPHRHAYYNSFRKIILERHPSDNADFVTKIGEALNELCDILNPSMVYVPLGVGTHIDHRLCFESAIKHLKTPVLFYEDRPYCFASLAVEIRLKMLGVRTNLSPAPLDLAHQNDISFHLSSLSKIKYVEKYLPEGKERTKCYDIISKQFKQKYNIAYLGSPEFHNSSTNDYEIANDAINAYESQLADFVVNTESFQQQSKIYSQSLTQQQEFVERYWVLEDSAI